MAPRPTTILKKFNVKDLQQMLRDNGIPYSKKKKPELIQLVLENEIPYQNYTSSRKKRPGQKPPQRPKKEPWSGEDFIPPPQTEDRQYKRPTLKRKTPLIIPSEPKIVIPEREKQPTMLEPIIIPNEEPINKRQDIEALLNRVSQDKQNRLKKKCLEILQILSKKWDLDTLKQNKPVICDIIRRNMDMPTKDLVRRIVYELIKDTNEDYLTNLSKPIPIVRLKPKEEEIDGFNNYVYQLIKNVERW